MNRIAKFFGFLSLSALLTASLGACVSDVEEDSEMTSDELKKCKKDKKKKCKDKDKDEDKDKEAPATTTGVPKASPAYAGKGKPYAWCNAANYKNSEKLAFEAGLPAAKTADLRPFRWATFNKVTLGMGPVGKSDTGAVKGLATRLAKKGTNLNALRSCTYFFNMTEDKSKTAAYDIADRAAEDNLTFNWSFVSNPSKQPDAKLLDAEYNNLASVLFSSKPTMKFVSPIPTGRKDPFIDNRDVIPMQRCAEEAGLLLMGCDSNHHRGPTVEGRFLAFAGCTPEDAYATVDALWGANGVPPEVRMRVIEQGVEDRTRYPMVAAKMQSLLLAP